MAVVLITKRSDGSSLSSIVDTDEETMCETIAEWRWLQNMDTPKEEQDQWYVIPTCPSVPPKREDVNDLPF